MAATRSFTRFPDLPAELRIQIWTEALTVSSAWALVLNKPRNVYDGGPLPHRRSISMTCVGSSPHLVGLACREARDVMERIYKRPLRGPVLEATVRGVHWIHLDKAVLAFVNSQDSLAILDRFGAEISRFQHVVLVWQNWTTHPQTCMRLAKSCPALRTVIVQRVESPRNRPYSSTSTTQCYMADAPVLLKLNAMTAAHYTALARYDGPEFGGADPDTVLLRKSILQYFADSPPRLHILAPNEVSQRLISVVGSLKDT
ncbi:hypothetical protein BR93DRAFT_928079 [Coniochaeta sp. PMI_546]|nr:hypothetical protein BR93DRAFT_928079 [Coniochaeta sp. PMI_546]